MKVYPTEFEGLMEDDGELVFKVTVLDEVSSSVDIQHPVTAESWADVADAIQRCLYAIRDGI